MTASKTDSRRRGTALVEYTWQGDRGLLLVADSPKGDLWLFPGGGAEARETRMAAAVRELHEEIGMVAYGALYLFSHSASNLHKVFLVRASGAPTIRDSAVKAIGLLLPDMSVRGISLRQRYSWPPAPSGSTRKIAERFFTLRDEHPAFFAAFDGYELGDDEDAAVFEA